MWLLVWQRRSISGFSHQLDFCLFPGKLFRGFQFSARLFLSSETLAAIGWHWTTWGRTQIIYHAHKSEEFLLVLWCFHLRNGIHSRCVRLDPCFGKDVTHVSDITGLYFRAFCIHAVSRWRHELSEALASSDHCVVLYVIFAPDKDIFYNDICSIDIGQGLILSSLEYFMCGFKFEG